MKKQLTILLLLSTMVTPCQIVAQNVGGDSSSRKETATAPRGKLIEAKGHVTDVHGEPIIGASVKVVGGTQGVITDLNGQFSITVPANTSLEISYLGFVPQKLKVTNGRNLNIVLSENTRVLKEVVVTALGIKREAKALGYAVTEVSGDEVNAAKPINPIDALSGKVPGVDISSTTAGPSGDRKSTRLNSSHANISYAVFCLIKKNAARGAAQRHEHLRGFNDHPSAVDPAHAHESRDAAVCSAAVIRQQHRHVTVVATAFIAY